MTNKRFVWGGGGGGGGWKGDIQGVEAGHVLLFFVVPVCGLDLTTNVNLLENILL